MTTPYTKLKEKIEKVCPNMLGEVDTIMSAIDEYIESTREKPRELTEEEIQTNAAIVDEVLKNF